MKSPLPSNEAQRLEALRQYAVLDTLPDTYFDDLTELAATICEAPIALITLIDENRQWFKSRVGFEVTATSRDIAFCAHAIHQPDLFIIPDTSLDPRFSDNPLVLDAPHIRFYAGAPLLTPTGHVLGTLCILDHEPREMRPDHKQALIVLRRHVMTQLELRRSMLEASRLRAERDKVLSFLHQQELSDLSQIEQQYTKGLDVNAHQAYTLFVAERNSRRTLVNMLENQKLAEEAPYASGQRFRVAFEAEEALRESEARYRTLVESAADGIFISNQQGHFVDVNKTGCRMLGYSREEILKLSIENIVVSEERARIAPEMARLSSSKVELSKWRFRRKDNTEFFGEVNATILPDGRLLGILRDITDRIQAEEAFLENERRLIVLMANLPGYIYRAANNSDYTPLFISEGVEQITGYAQREYLIDHTITRGAEIHPDDRYAVWKTVRRMLESNAPFECEYRIHTKSGELRWVWERGRGIYGQSNELLYLEGFVTDVTSRKQAEQEIRRLNIELEQRVAERTKQLETSNREIESFAYSVSHDLRTPLRNIAGFSQVLVEDYANQLDEQAKNYLYRVRAAAQRMGLLIEDILKLSRITRQEILTQTINLSEIVQKLSAELRSDAPERQVLFNIASGIIVQADARLLEIAMTNLLSNAWKYSSKKSEAKIEFGEEVKCSGNVYFVRDNGAGFDMRYATKLFSAFQRMHTTSEFEGTGIGLATVARIIHRHGGEIWATSEVDKGATFYFTLPPPR